jgi:hypothetical protein
MWEPFEAREDAAVFLRENTDSAVRVITPAPVVGYPRASTERANFPMIQTRSLRSSITSGALRSSCPAAGA